MPQSKPFALPPSVLNEFLLAEVGTQTNGLSLTVLSLLARTGKDPWEEAERLAGLPNETAIAAMSAAIADSRICVTSECDPNAVATRLVSRLPSHFHSAGADAAGLGAPPINHPAFLFLALWITFGAMLIAFVSRT